MLARHIGFVHKNKCHPSSRHTFSSEFLRGYVTLAKTFTPMISEEVSAFIQQKYVEKRR